MKLQNIALAFTLVLAVLFVKPTRAQAGGDMSGGRPEGPVYVEPQENSRRDYYRPDYGYRNDYSIPYYQNQSFYYRPYKKHYYGTYYYPARHTGYYPYYRNSYGMRSNRYYYRY